MKTKKYLLVITLVLFFLLSCSQDHILVKYDNRIDDSINSLDVKYNYTIKGNTSDEFSFFIEKNPIDLKYKELYEAYDGSSQMIVEIETKYKNWWYTEMEVAYNQLLKLLDGDDSQNLIKSQISWKSYMESKKYIEESFFYQHKYDSVGELRKALSVYEEADETKARAYSLLEYIYIISGEINMVFNCNHKTTSI